MLNIDLKQATRFIQFIHGDANQSLCWQVFHDSRNSVDTLKQPKTFHAKLDDCVEYINQIQAHNYGVYITLNRTDGKGREEENIVGYTTLFADFDDTELPHFPLQPHLITQRDSRHSHCYWKVKGIVTDQQFKKYQKQVAMYLNSDEQVTDPSRVVRLAGSYNAKDSTNHMMYKIVQDFTELVGRDHTYSLDEINEKFKLTGEKLAKLEQWTGSRNSLDTGEGFNDNPVYREQLINFLGRAEPAVEGNGTMTLIKVASFGYDKGIPLSECQEIMWEHYNPRCEPMWKEHEHKHFNDVLGRAYKYANNAVGCRTCTAEFAAEATPVIEPPMGWTENAKLATKTTKFESKFLTIYPVAQKLADKIKHLCEVEICVDTQAINQMINGAFYSTQKKHLVMLNQNGDVIEASLKDDWNFLSKTFGQVVNTNEYQKKVEELITPQKLSKQEHKQLIKEYMAKPSRIILEHIRYYNQRGSVEIAVDMFANTGRIEMKDESAFIIFPHKPLEEQGYNKAIIADYLEHYKGFNEFIQWLVACRFAGDRKKAFMWIRADSDWGKGCLIHVLTSHGIGTEISVKEVEKIYEGGAVGKSMKDFKRSIALIIDEFKTVKSEVKQLQNSITISPKNQLSTRVPLYAKLFLSAENVDSLVSSTGVEEQFIKRFNYFRFKGSIESRPLFIKSKSEYINNVKNYFAEKFNFLVNEMVLIGENSATKKADDILNQFHAKNGLGQYFNNLLDNLPEIANEVIKWVISEGLPHTAKDIINSHDGKIYLKSPEKWVKAYITDKFAPPESYTLSRKASEIIENIDIDNSGVKLRSVSGNKHRCLRIK